MVDITRALIGISIRKIDGVRAPPEPDAPEKEP